MPTAATSYPSAVSAAVNLSVLAKPKVKVASFSSVLADVCSSQAVASHQLNPHSRLLWEPQSRQFVLGFFIKDAQKADSEEHLDITTCLDGYVLK